MCAKYRTISLLLNPCFPTFCTTIAFKSYTTNFLMENVFLLLVGAKFCTYIDGLIELVLPNESRASAHIHVNRMGQGTGWEYITM